MAQWSLFQQECFYLVLHKRLSNTPAKCVFHAILLRSPVAEQDGI